MENKHCSKADLKDIALNDLEYCMRSASTSDRPNQAHADLALSVQVANIIGVPLESVASTLLNALPACERQCAVERVVKKFKLTDSQVRKLLDSQE